MRWDVLLFCAAILVFIVFFLRVVTRRRRPQTFQYDGRTYVRQPDGSFIGPGGLLVTGAMAGILAGAYKSRQEKLTDNSWSWSGGGSDSSDGDGCSGDGGDSGGGDGGGGGGDGGGGGGGD